MLNEQQLSYELDNQIQKLKIESYELIDTIQEKDEIVNNLYQKINQLENELLFLHCLQEMGIDNWSGYGDAQVLYDEYLNEAEND